jgi:hypothetical protein
LSHPILILALHFTPVLIPELQTAWGRTPHSPKALKTYNKAQEITSKSTSYNNTQTPPDLVVKFQPIDNVDFILRLLRRPRVVYQREVGVFQTC